MAEAIARVHVDDYDPEVYRGENALEMALIMARQMRHDFPGATVGVSYNAQSVEEKRAKTLARYGIDSADSSNGDNCGA